MHLKSLFAPRSIAIIGASTKKGSVGWSLTDNVLHFGYTGKVHLINPKVATLFGLPCYKSISEITDEVDLAIIIVPATIVPQVLKEVGEKGIPACIIISSGFKESGTDGEKREDEIKNIAETFNIALLGPNCLGFLHPKIGLNASFAKGMPKQGNIAFFSQSGALCTALLDLSIERLGFSLFVSNGNKTVLEENKLLQYFAKEETTEVIGFYTEGLSQARAIIETSHAILARSNPKPIITLKSGTTAAGTQASSSHTGALAGSDAAYQALFKQARIIRADSLESLSDLLTTFSQNPLPRGSNIGIITNAGGLGVLATDAAEKHGLKLAVLSSETLQKLEKLPAAASRNNPVDVLGDALADRYHLALETLSHDPQVDMLLVIVTPQTMTQAKETAEAIVDTKNHCDKPIVAAFAGGESLQAGLSVLQKNKVATITYPESAAASLAALAQVADWRKKLFSTPFVFHDIDKAIVKKIIATARQEERTTLYETEVWTILSAYGFQFLKSVVIKSPEEASASAKNFSKNIALKIISPDITHKSDVGGVLLDITPDEAGEKYETLLAQVKKNVPEARLEGALMVEMAHPGGREIILGMKTEPGLGKLLMIGLGGIYVETFKDVTFRFSPLFEEDAQEMIQELKSLSLLTGTRGQEGVDRNALVSAIGRLSLLVQDFPEIEELDINPLLAFQSASEFRVLDARIRLQEEK